MENAVKPVAFQYHAPRTLPEALAILSENEDSRPLAGGQSLVPMLNLRLAAPEHLIDLGRVQGLSGISKCEKGLVISAMTTQRDIERSALVARECPLLVEAIGEVGHQQTRNRGTIGGSIVHMDPAAELPVVALALNATLDIAGPDGTRTINVQDLASGYLTTQIAPEELLVAVHIPSLNFGTGTGFVEVARRPADFAIVSAASVVELDESKTIKRISVSVGGLSFAPIRLYEFEDSVVEDTWDDEIIDKAVARVREQPADDKGEYSGDYCSHLAGVLVSRVLKRAVARASGDDHAALS